MQACQVFCQWAFNNVVTGVCQCPVPGGPGKTGLADTSTAEFAVHLRHCNRPHVAAGLQVKALRTASMHELWVHSKYDLLCVHLRSTCIKCVFTSTIRYTEPCLFQLALIVCHFTC